MDPDFARPARFFAFGVSLLAVGSLLAQIYGNMQRGENLGPVVGWIFQNFTIWGNFAAGLVFGWIAWRGRVEPRVRLW